MRLGASLFLIALGAILKFAVTKHISGIDLAVVGVILMVIGAIGLLAEVIMWGTRRHTTIISRAPGVTYAAPQEPLDRTY